MLEDQMHINLKTTMTPIKPIPFNKYEVRFADYEAANESIVRVNFYTLEKLRIASRIVAIPPDEELSPESVWKAASVEILT
jgi:hypothetical protein